LRYMVGRTCHQDLARRQIQAAIGRKCHRAKIPALAPRSRAGALKHGSQRFAEYSPTSTRNSRLAAPALLRDSACVHQPHAC
jgi:hypothetical protein